MRLVDTSILVDLLSRGEHDVGALLRRDEALIHPYVIGEIMLGSLANRAGTLMFLSKMEFAEVASSQQVLDLIEDERLHGTGIGYVDAHLLASAQLTSHCRLWTRDRRLHAVAERLGVAA